MKADFPNNVRRIITLFAGFVLGMHVAVLLHEFGHALGYWLSGGTVTKIVMQSPLPAGKVEGFGPHEYRYLPVWGGVVFGTTIALAPLAVAWRLARHTVIRFAALMSAAFCLGHNGMYLLVGSILPFGDASMMVSLGVSRPLMFALGVPLIVGFVVVLTSAIKLAGVSSTESVLKTIIIVEVGLFTFPAVMVSSMFFMPVASSVRSPTIAFVSCYGICFCIAACWARANLTDISPVTQRWSGPCKMMLTAVVLVFVEWLAFGAA